jgi:hypothetical protein
MTINAAASGRPRSPFYLPIAARRTIVLIDENNINNTLDE